MKQNLLTQELFSKGLASGGACGVGVVYISVTIVSFVLMWLCTGRLVMGLVAPQIQKISEKFICLSEVQY